MKLKNVFLIFAALGLTSGYSKTPEQWICVNARDVGGLYSLEVRATTSMGDQPWRSLDVFLVKDNHQQFDTIESYAYPPALTGVGGNSNEVVVEGKNRQVFGRVTASLTVTLAHAKRAPFSSYILALAGMPIRGSAAVYEGTLMLDTGSRADGNEIPLNCAAMPRN